MLKVPCDFGIIPNYNNEEFLLQCIESVQKQTHQSLEIIIVDDCSTDNSQDIIKKCGDRDKRIVAMFNEENLGVSRNRHKGILLSKGNYITTLDGDDVYFSSDKLARELYLLHEKQKGGIDNAITFSGIVLIDRQGKVIGKRKAKVMEGNILNELMGRSCMIPRDFLFTRDQYLESRGFDANIPIYEDWDLKIRLASENSFYYTGIDGIGYRRHGQGLSATSPLRHSWWLLKIFLKNYHLIRDEKTKTAKQFIRFLVGMYSNYVRKKLSPV